MTQPFAYNNASTANSGQWDPLAAFGQPPQQAGQGANMFSVGGQQFDISQLPIAEQIEFAQRQQGNEIGQQQVTAFGAANPPPSKWATGAQTFGNVAQGLAGLGNIYLGFQGMKQQKKAFEFNKGITNTNMNNSIMDYNRRLGETLTNRALNNGQGDGWVSSQLQKYSAKRTP